MDDKLFLSKVVYREDLEKPQPLKGIPSQVLIRELNGLPLEKPIILPADGSMIALRFDGEKWVEVDGV